MSERDTLRVEMTEARNQISVCEEELGRALGLASEFRRKVGSRRLYSGVLRIKRGQRLCELHMLSRNL